MTLGEVVRFLEKMDPNLRVPHGFGSPHSYRGYYDYLAFDPDQDTTVGEMLRSARGAINRTFTGYKGGEYRMDEDTPCYLAEFGELGEELGPMLLSFIIWERIGTEKE